MLPNANWIYDLQGKTLMSSWTPETHKWGEGWRWFRRMYLHVFWVTFGAADVLRHSQLGVWQEALLEEFWILASCLVHLNILQQLYVPVEEMVPSYKGILCKQTQSGKLWGHVSPIFVLYEQSGVIISRTMVYYSPHHLFLWLGFSLSTQHEVSDILWLKVMSLHRRKLKGSGNDSKMSHNWQNQFK